MTGLRKISTCSILDKMIKRNFVNNVKSYFKKNPVVRVNGYCATKKSPNFDLEVNRMVWVDMEMTGLDIEQDKIMEVACIVTDSDLNIIAEGPNIIIHHPKSVLDNMNEWCIKQHGMTGLTEECLKSNIMIKEAEDKLLEFISNHVTEKVSPLAGNSVYMDRLFLKKYMPRVNEYLHYRIIDVSSIKELCRRWNSVLYKDVPKKEFSHRALADIKESIEELKFYKKHFFKLA